MRQGNIPGITFGLSGFGGWLVFFGIIWLLGSVGLGWLVKSVVVLVLFLAIAPIIAIIGFRWWLRRNLVESQCPVCAYQSAGLNGTQLRCPSCNEPLKVEKGDFVRLTPPGTVDVQAVEVQAQVVED
jgi:ssDNA-binding Zn-finger/Zn-ribbon topoisomerase 1